MTDPRTRGSDLGLTWLAGSFHSGWRSEGTDLEFVAALLSRTPLEDVEAVLTDVTRLAESDLPEWAVESLWNLGSYPRHDLHRQGWNGREWLQQVIQLCSTRLSTAGLNTSTSLPPSPYCHLAGAVLDEILVVAEPMTEASLNPGKTGRVPGPSGFVPALCELANKVCPDLAFRLLLNALAHFGPRVSSQQYARYKDLGQRFEYGEIFIESYDHLMSE